MENKDVYDAVWKRRSVRKYLDKHIEESKIEALRKSISDLNETSGLTMELVEESDSFRSIKAFMFKNVRTVIAVKGKTKDHDLNEKCGYYGEQIVLEATALGLGTCWVAATFKKRSSSLNIKDDETIVCAIPVGYGAEETIGSANVMDVPQRKTISVSDFLGGNTKVPEWILSAMRAVQFAPTAMNSQKARFSYSDGKLSIQIPHSELNMVDLGITKFHFELAAGGKFPLGTPSEFVKE